jgi:hypothetical protein
MGTRSLTTFVSSQAKSEEFASMPAQIGRPTARIIETVEAKEY